jgi:hypothetical protein
VNEDFKQQEAQLRDDVYGAIDEVGAALEDKEDAKELAAGKLVDPLIARYEELVAPLPALSPERERIERGLGRMLTDLRRMASKLTRRSSGNKAERAKDAGGQPFLLERAPSPFLTKGLNVPTRRRTPESVLAVGGEVEAWCGKCKESRTHRIVVVQDNKPGRVQCVHCRSQHGYRVEPSARATGGPGEGGPPRQTARAVVDLDAQKRRLDREKLQAELNSVAVADIRSFDPSGIYKSGQVIEHPKYGRGKIESITRGSLLVRFMDGLRPISRNY